MPFTEFDIKADISSYEFNSSDYCTYNLFDNQTNKKNLKHSRSDYQAIPAAPEIPNEAKELLKDLSANNQTVSISNDYFNIGI